ncbi:heavy metal sensor histidine kinase [Pseudomonas citronellolis]|uniref:heavy metal sensor histidine kinase n=1 Tax=Pseudomonas citronellolis TaxID=53408 RepID=UPI0023E400D1|nr:heavy metal sensor histidine kinase [Pseudomonas citronellolis]MDF3933171.1 heavy metal sensor histidine kinase [Pseudomonas citronellolis]
MSAAARVSLGVRLSLLFAASTAAISLIAGAVFSRASEAHFIELDRQVMAGRLPYFRELLGPVRGPAELAPQRPALERELTRHPDLGVRLDGADGQRWLDEAPRMSSGGDGMPGMDDGPAYREMRVPLDPGEPAGRQLTLVLDITHHQHFLGHMQQLIWLTMGLSALATALLGAWATRASLRPLRRMREVAARVSAQSLTPRLDAGRLPAELSGLASELNAMLERLEEAFQRLSAFSADIAHELRTPLTALLTQTQVVLSRPRDAESYREALHGNLEELQRLTAMVNDMLLLAKADHGLLAPGREDLDLAAEVDALLEFYAPLAEDGGLSLTREGQARTTGDRGMLRRVLANLLDNALRFTPAGGAIRVALRPGRISVENQGPAIPAEQLARLFDRFHHREAPGGPGQGVHAGLGLAICRSIVQAHGGTLSAESADGWTRFVIELPARR